VIVRQEAILDWLREVRSATLREIAQHFGCSQHSARMKADGLVAQGKLDVKPGARAQGGRPVMPRRYSVPQPEADLGGGLAVACEEGPQHRLELPAGSS
jgi:predicted ArsR family transcriptional regulator